MKVFFFINFLFLVFVYAPLQAATYIVQAKGMMCESCVQTVTDGFMKIEGVKNVTVDLENQTVSIDSDAPIAAEAAKTIMTERGYEFIEINVANPISSFNE